MSAAAGGAPRRPVRSPVDVASVPVSLTVSVVSGLLAGVLGTGVHANLWRVTPQVWIPWGALLALGLLLSLCVWSGATTRRVWAAALSGMVAYAVSYVLAFARPDSALIVLDPSAAVGVAGMLWFGGILVVTLAAVVVVGRWWRCRRAAARAVSAGPHPLTDAGPAGGAPAEGPDGPA